MSLIPKLGRAFFNISGMLIAALLVWANPVMSEEALPPEVVSDAEPGFKSAPCKGLKPYNNLDELLYQFYINLKSDCLFEMTTAELEKVWGIKILDEEQKRSGRQYDPVEFWLKPYKEGNDAFYVCTDRSYSGGTKIISIKVTAEFYEKHATLFPDGAYPVLLPEPSVKNIFRTIPLISVDTRFELPHTPRKNDKYNLEEYQYYWVSSDRTRVIVLMGEYGVDRIIMENKRNPKHYQ